MTEKCWFVLQHKHFPPDGPIKLGQLVSNPAEPYQVIDFSGPSPYPPNMPIIASVEQNFAWDSATKSDENLTLSSRTNGLPVSGAVRAEFKNTTHSYAQFETLETTIIVPTPEFISSSMNRPVIKEFLSSHVLPKKVFMITGLKIGRKGKAGHERTINRDFGLQLGVQPTSGMSFSLGPDIRGERENSERVSSTASDFVWAFSLRQIHYRRGKPGKSSTYTDGATLGVNDDEDNDMDDSEEERPVDPATLEISVDGLDAENFNGQNSDLLKVSGIVDAGNGETLVTIDNR
ncbi:hypothetical protein N431DRAFT_471420 [Stipitochalara longipes BDJ]|nr:hypothetical protein N431DRAFT_471420 [Stipitochalara longipes BDJ]